MRISDWSSDVCSSDLIDRIPVADPARKTADHHRRPGKAARIGGDRAVPCKGGQIFRPSHPRQDARDEQPHGDEEQREADREYPDEMSFVHGTPFLALPRLSPDLREIGAPMHPPGEAETEERR